MKTNVKALVLVDKHSLMYTPFVRFLLILAAILLLIWGIYLLDPINISMALIAMLSLIWGYFKSGTVYLSFKHLANGNYAKAEQRLMQTKNPAYLSTGQKSYYYFILGFLTLQQQNWQKSISNFDKALQIGLRTENDKAIALLHIAESYFALQNYSTSQEYLTQASSLQHKPLVAKQIEQLKEKIKQLN